MKYFLLIFSMFLGGVSLSEESASQISIFICGANEDDINNSICKKVVSLLKKNNLNVKNGNECFFAEEGVQAGLDETKFIEYSKKKGINKVCIISINSSYDLNQISVRLIHCIPEKELDSCLIYDVVERKKTSSLCNKIVKKILNFNMK